MTAETRQPVICASAPTPIFVRPYQVQAIFGIHSSTLYRWAAEGLITIHKRGTMSFVRASELERLITKMGD